MRQGLLYNYPPFAQLIFSLLLTFSIGFFIIFTGMLIAIPAFDISLFQLPNILNDFGNPENLQLIKYLQLLQSTGLFVIPPFIIGYLISRDPASYLNLNSNSSLIVFIVAGFIMVGSLPVINFFAELNAKLNLPDFLSRIENWMKETEEEASELTKVFVKAGTFKQFLFNLLMIAVIPAIGEELLFRGVIQKLCIKWIKRVFWGVFITSFIFSFFHLQFYGFVPRLILGFVLGYLYVYSKTIWVPIFLAVFVYYRFGDKFVAENIDKIGTAGASFYYCVISIVLVGFLFYFLKKYLLPKSINSE